MRKAYRRRRPPPAAADLQERILRLEGQILRLEGRQEAHEAEARRRLDVLEAHGDAATDLLAILTRRVFDML